MDEAKGLMPKEVKEHHQATGLAFQATKQTASFIGCSVAGMMAIEKHLRLNLTDLKDKEKTFWLNSPILQSGLVHNHCLC